MATSLEDALSKLTAPRYVWLMLPSGDITEHAITSLQSQLASGDVVIDGGQFQLS